MQFSGNVFSFTLDTFGEFLNKMFDTDLIVINHVMKFKPSSMIDGFNRKV